MKDSLIDGNNIIIYIRMYLLYTSSHDTTCDDVKGVFLKRLSKKKM